MRSETSHLKIIGSALLLLGTCVSLSWGAPSEIEKAAKYAERGMRELEAANAGRAEQFFDKSIRLVPEYPDAHLGLGHLAMQAGDVGKALTEYETARDGYAVLGNRLLDIMRTRYREQKNKIPDLKQQIALIQSGEIRLTENERRIKISDLEMTIRDLEAMSEPSVKTVAEPPGEVFFRIGIALAKLGRWEEAVVSLEACTARSPTFAQAYSNLALAYWKTGRHDDALSSLDKAEDLGLEINPRFRSDIEHSKASENPSASRQS
jgi:tetratricopeptide (TPR) repeat protein